MSYCTLAQLIERYGEERLVSLTDRAEEATGEIDAAVVDRAIADTDALIDGYLAGRYALPLSETPALVTDLTLTVAYYKLHGNAASDKMTTDYKDALATLKLIANGTVRLSVDGAEPSASDAGKVQTNEPERPMTAETMKGYI